MPQSYHCMLVHLIWSTKRRQHLIRPEIETELFKYMSSIFRKNNSPALIINGFTDHVHILINLSRSVSLANLVEEVKANSSKWIKSKGQQYNNFYWQTGYAAFSVGQRHVGILKRYISNQKEHHLRKSFKVEYLKFLNLNLIKYDDQYLWD